MVGIYFLFFRKQRAQRPPAGDKLTIVRKQDNNN